MSRLELGKIIASHKATDPNNYVASIISSESGPIDPMMITDDNELNSLYDDFKYKPMYSRLLAHNIPSVLTPILTGVSQYNRSSIRINDKEAYVSYTHPRIDKKYNYNRQGNVVVNRSIIPTRSVEVTTLSKMPISYLLVDENGEIVSHDICTAKYYQEESGYYKIKFNFNRDWIGNIIVASYPSYENNPEFTIPQYSDEKTIINGEYPTIFSLPDDTAPDFVILDEDGYEINTYDAYIECESGEYLFNIKLLNANFGYIYIRKMTEDIVYSQMLTQEITNINHGLGYYPNIKELNYDQNIIKFVDPVRTENQRITNITKDDLEVKIDNIAYPMYIEHITNNRDNQIYIIDQPSNEFSVRSLTKYHSPYILLAQTDNGYEVIESNAIYSFDSNGYSIINFKLSKPITGAVIVSKFLSSEDEADEKKLFKKTFTGSISFKLDYNVLPLVVGVNYEGNRVQLNPSIQEVNGQYICTLESYSNFPVTAYVQILDEDITLASKLITGEITTIGTNLSYNPYARVIVNKEGTLMEYVAQLNYNSIEDAINKSYIVSINDYKSPTNIQYCVLLESDENKINVEQLRLNEVTYSMVLDFTESPDINPNDIDNLYNHYLLLKINGVRVLYIRIVNSREPVISNDYYDELVTLYSNSIPNIIEEIRGDIARRITEDNLLSYRDECIKSLKLAWEYATKEIPQGEPNISAGVYYDQHTNTLTTTNSWSGIKYRLADEFNEKVTKLQVFTENPAKLQLIVTYSDSSQSENNDVGATKIHTIDINKNKVLKNIEIISLVPSTITFNKIILTTVEKLGEVNIVELNPDNFVSDDFSDNAYYDWRELLFEKLYERELFLGSYKTLINFIKTNLTTYTDLENIIHRINISNEFSINKLLINYRSPSSNLNFYKFEGLKLYTCFNSEQDVLSEFTEDSKLVEFYSKLKGPKGQETVITIDEVNDYYYEIKIQLESIVEYFYVYTNKTDNTPEDAEDIHVISSKSKLVDVKIYDYVLPSGQIIDQYDFIDYYDMDKFDSNRVRLVSIPSGTYKLGRNMQEYPDYEDWQYTLSQLSESGFYPDLFLVPEVFNHHEFQQYKDITSYVRGNEVNIYGGICSTGVFSQALCTVRWRYFQNPNPDKLPDSNNRMLYFYEDLELDDNPYPVFYPYIEALIRGTGLEIPNELILTTPNEIRVGNAVVYHNQPYLIKDIMSNGNLYCIDSNDSYHTINPKYCTKITSLMDKLNVNYLDYNGLYYYHTTWKEKIGQPSVFIVQYSCSKISREFYKAQGILLSTNYYTIQNPVISLISRILNIVPYVNTISHEIINEGSRVRINLSVVLKGLINKKFLVDYILNLF
jgi:hypothetical protein